MNIPNYTLSDYTGIDSKSTTKGYPNYSLSGDYGYSYDTKLDYYKQQLEEREAALQKQAEEVPTQEESSSPLDQEWWTARPVGKAKKHKGNGLNILDDLMNENRESAEGTLPDIWRSFQEKKDQSKLSRLQNEVREGESAWIKGINLANDYLTTKKELVDLQKQLDTQKDWTESQQQAAVNRINELKDRLKYIEDGQTQLDDNGNPIYHLPGLKELARTNPYLQDIFYETTPGKLFANEKFGKITDLLKYYSYDWLADNQIFDDWNPGNNFKHMLSTDGIQDPLFGRTHQLSPEQINYMWDSKTNDRNLDKQIAQLESASKTAEAKLNDKNQQIQSLIHTLKHGNWLYDPSKISPEFREKQEHNDITAFDPESWIYALPELGTSYSEFGAFMGQMGVSMAARYAAKAALAAGTGGTAPLLIAAAETAAQAAITQYTRNSETQAELFDSFKQRVLEGADELHINLPSVIKDADEQLRARGFDTSEMTDYEVLENALSQNIITPDQNFNQLIQDSQKGLDVVRQTNQALMLSDLAEGMYMFGGRYLKGAFGLKSAARKALGNRPVSDALAESVAQRLPETKGLYRSAVETVDRTIARAVDKAWKTPGGKTRAYNAVTNLAKLGKKLGVQYFAEKTEEGQQGVVSDYYRRGKYDNVEGYSFLDGAANALKLAGEAHLSYYGLHPDENLNGDAELRKAMDIGGFTGLFMGSVFSSPDVYSATQQFLMDSNLRGYISDGYGDAEKQNKVEQFMKAADSGKSGAYGRITKNLETLKEKFKPEGVTNEMIDEDIKLVNTIDRLSNNKTLRSMTQDLGIYGDDFISVVKNAISLQDRLDDAQKSSVESTKEVEELLQKVKSDEGLLSEISQHYQDYLARHKKKRADKRREIVNNMSAADIEARDKKQLSKYVDELLGEDVVLTEEEYTNEFLGRMAVVHEYNTLLQLRDELNARKQDLIQLKEDKGLDVNVEGISGIIEYIEAQIKQRKPMIEKFMGTDATVGEQVLDLGLSVPFNDQLTTAVMTKHINDGVRADLFAHIAAYTTGRYVGNTRLYKPTWNNLTDEQQQEIADKQFNLAQAEGKNITYDEIRNQYNQQVEEEWAKDDKLADQDAVQRKRAKAVIQKDLQRKKKQEAVSRQEISEDTGGLPLLLEGTPNSETASTEAQQIEQPQTEEEPVIPDLGTGTSDAEMTNLEQKVSELDKAIEGAQEREKVELEEMDKIEEEPQPTEQDEVSNDNQDLEDQIQRENPPEEVPQVEPTDLAEEVTPDTSGDIASNDAIDESQDLAEPVNDDESVEEPENAPETHSEALGDTFQEEDEESIEEKQPTLKTPENASNEQLVDGKPLSQLKPDDLIHATVTYNGLTHIHQILPWSKRVGDLRGSSVHWGYDDRAGLWYFFKPAPKGSGRLGDNTTVWFRFEPTDEVKRVTEEQLNNRLRTDFDVITDAVKRSLQQPKESENASEETPAVGDVIPEVENPVSVTEVEDTPSASNLFYDNIGDQLLYSPSGNPDEATPIDDNAITIQSIFEEGYDFDPRLEGPAAHYNKSSNGFVRAKKRFRKLHIGNTFFYPPTAEDVMPITVAGKPVKFTSKDGGKVERRPGKELAEKLAIPGWLATADDVYYVVSSSTHDMSGQNAIDNLAIHLMIEKDGKLYNASLRAINAKLYNQMADTEMTEDEINAQIEALRALRAKIIRAYAPEYSATKTLPTEAKKHVKPVGLRISNGALDNQVDEAGLPKFRKLTEVKDFGISEDVEKMSEQITSGEIQFGYGTGPYGSEPFAIEDMYTREQTEVQGTGYAGKVYLIPKPESTPSGTATLPIMLSEELHRIPDVNNPKQVKLALNAKGKWNKGEDGKPVKMSTAELIFELICGSIKYRIPSENRDIIADFMLKLLANAGTKTFMNNADNIDKVKYNFLVRKQLGIFEDDKGNRFFVNGYYAEDTKVMIPQGVRMEKRYSTQYTNLATLTQGDEQYANYEKQKIVYQISQNIHWNTDKDVLMSAFPEEFVQFVIDAGLHTNQIKDENSRIMLFSPDFTFSLKDLGYTFKDGKAVKVYDSPLVMTWAINNGIIKTDLGEHAFSAPFVYADDVAVSQEVKQKQEEKPKPTVNTKNQVIEPVSKPAEVKTQSGKKVVTAERATPENLAKYGLSIPDNGMKESPGMKWGIVVNPKTGKREVRLVSPKFINGLKSTVRGKGTVNEEAAKKWLLDKLGIDADQILITDQMVKFGANEEAYGLFSVIMDAITGELLPQISLSRKAGQGVEYHEAFHFVTQLLLNEAQRKALYQEYAKTHKDTQGLTQNEAEEALAEEFRNYCLDQNRTGLLYKVIKFFKNLYNWIQFWNINKKHIRAFFKSINRGDFKNYKVSKEALQAFYEKKPEGLSYYIPGLSKSEEAKLPHITDPDIFYHAVNSLTSGALTIFNIRTIDDVHNLNTSALFDMLQQNIDFGWISDEYADIAQDIVNNKDIFTRYVRKKLEQLGIREIEKVDKEEDARLAVETGEQADNNWDRNQGEVSKKDNISFRAKLFFYSIPKYKYEFVQDENGVVTKQLTPVVDDMFQLPVTEDFNYVWNQIMENLWDIDSYQDIVDRSAKLSNTTPFFKALYDILTSEEAPLSENTKTQLEVTIKSSKVQLDTIETKHPKVNTYGKSDEKIAADISASMKKFDWVVSDSDNLRKISRLPERWSGAFFASDAIDRDNSGRPFIKKEFGEYLTKRCTKINSAINVIRKRINNNQQVDDTKIQEIKDALLQIFNALSIPMDNLALDYMLNNFYTGATEFARIRNFWKGVGTSNKFNRFNEGTLATIIKLAKNGGIGVKSNSSTGYARTLDRMFTFGKGSDSQMAAVAISYGKVHPSPQEFSVVGADGALIYPISENNYMTDQIRNINQNANGKREQILNTPFSAHSLIANAKDTKFKLHTFLALNIDDTSRDYFGITPVEDYIAKLTLTFNDRLILPTMSDKKTWYSISGLKLVKDVLQSKGIDEGLIAYEAITGEDSNEDYITFVDRKFSDNTLKVFANYWLDEFNAVWDYFQKKDYVAQHPTLRVDNYHGKIKNGKMDHTGNGGRFRYFTKLRVGDEVLNVNQKLASLEQHGTTKEVQEYLLNLKTLLLGTSSPNAKEFIVKNAPIYKAINNLLIESTQDEMKALVGRGIIGYKNKLYFNKLIPNNIWKYYESQIDKKFYTADEIGLMNEDILFSIIGSHVANQAISVMEVEKCFTGDPAYYKWKKSKQKVEDGTVSEIITGKDVDKIKRLSAVLSTGTNLRTIWDNPAENDTTVTVMHLADNKLGSEYYDQLEGIFRNSILRDLYSEQNPTLTDNQIIEALSTKEKEDAFYKTLSDEQKAFVDSYTKASASPYSFEKDDEGNITSGSINQSDAAVYVRPAMYRRIMKALGQWNDEIEEAYQIMEGEDESWLSDPILYSKTLALVVKPLKMVYFGDHREGDLNLNIPVFDKMAMFPLFKVMAKADNKLLYNRMNNEKLGVIDMLTFESAVKVGGRTKFQAYEGPKNEHFNEESLNRKSFNLTKKEGDLPVFVQDIRNLRLQLNTDPHEHMDRSFGTQAVKICLGNLIEDREYGSNKGLKKTGAEIRQSTMGAINALSDKGYKSIIKRFFKNGSLSNKALSDYLISQAVSSGMSDEFVKGLTIDSDGNIMVPLAAQSSRQWVESRIISYINKAVVDINTPGGSAIQMSSFGLKATDARMTEADLNGAFNKGKKLRFLNKDGSMDVILSTNFFRHIVPKEYQTSYGAMKKWLLDHNVIGENSTPQGIGYRIPTQGLSSTFSFKVVDVLPDRFGDTVVVPDEFTAMTGSDFD